MGWKLEYKDSLIENDSDLKTNLKM
jgi:hypothetical protein